MRPLILGLHGSFEETPAKGVHDAAYCLADPNRHKVLTLVEVEKLSGVRHDGRLPQELLKVELANYRGAPIHIVSSHFTTFGDDSPREFPLFRYLDRLDSSNLRFCYREELSLFGSQFPG